MNRFDGLLAETDVAQDLTFQIRDGGDDAAIGDVPSQHAGPELDPIRPGRSGWREMKFQIGALNRELLRQVGLVRWEVVEDGIHLGNVVLPPACRPGSFRWS
ncbi:MAG: hypothetical protein P4L40_08155 [Terracidiphilus sp.]|nr:hypothetical protein [Terracidiphilus sp.]